MLSVIQDAYVPNTISEDLEYSVMEKWFAAAALICMIQLRVSCVRIIILLVKYKLYFHTSRTSDILPPNCVHKLTKVAL